jgi:hypothetical protein
MECEHGKEEERGKDGTGKQREAHGRDQAMQCSGRDVWRDNSETSGKSESRSRSTVERGHHRVLITKSEERQASRGTADVRHR